MMSANDMSLTELVTPSLVLDKSRMESNIRRLQSRTNEIGVHLRPHLKTVKSLEISKSLLAHSRGTCAVSTLEEIRLFGNHGATDILYAVGIALGKLRHIAALRTKNINVSVLLDSVVQARAVVKASQTAGIDIPSFIEVDVDGHRGGLSPDDPQLPVVADTLRAGGVECRGLLSHAGESYNCATIKEAAACAELERVRTLRAADVLRDRGHTCPVISVGSTPTALSGMDFTGITEVRAGVFVFMDLVMAGIGVCLPRDIAISVLTSVIGKQESRNRVFIDAGWMALSRDQGSVGQKLHHGYGVVCDIHGDVLEDLIVTDVTQEHGIIESRQGSKGRLTNLEIGTLLRILPNHACATASQHASYQVVSGRETKLEATWNRCRGW